VFDRVIITWMRQLQGGLFGIHDICPHGVTDFSMG